MSEDLDQREREREGELLGEADFYRFTGVYIPECADGGLRPL